MSMAGRPCRTGRPTVARSSFTLNECAIALMDADGGNLSEIASDPGACLNDANYTPDGARLVFTRFDFALEVEQIWSMKTDGSDQQFITDAGGPDPNVSPDGTKLSFKGPPDGALFVANIDGSAHRPDLALDLGHLQARLGAGWPTPRRQRQLRAGPG